MTIRTRVLLSVPLLSGALMAAAWAAAPSATPAASPAADRATPESDVPEASCLLKITSDPTIFPLEPQIVQFLLASSGVTQDAVREVLGETAQVEVEFELLGGAQPGTPGAGRAPSRGGRAMGGGMGGMGGMGGGFGGGSGAGGLMNPFGPGAASPISLPDSEEQMLIGQLRVVSPERGHAREVMTAVTERFQAALEKAASTEKERLREGLKTATEQVMKAQVEMRQLQEIRQKMLESTSFSDLARDSILEMSRKLEAERQDTAVRIEALRARQEALRKHAAEKGEQAKETAATEHPALAPHREKLAELRHQLEALKSPQSEQHPQQLKEAEAALQRVQAELEKRRQDLARSEVVALLSGLNDQTASLSIDLTEAEARLKTLDSKCRELREALSKADEYELRVGLELPLARSAYEAARIRQQTLETRLSSIRPPAVTVLGG